MGHIAVSATWAFSGTLQIWQHGAIENYCDFVSFNRVVDTKTNPNGAKYIKRWLENESKPIIILKFLKIPSLISTDQKENIICTMDDVRGDFLGPPHGTAPAAKDPCLYAIAL